MVNLKRPELLVAGIMGWVCAIFLGVMYLAQPDPKPVVKIVTKTEVVTKKVKVPRTEGLKHLAFLDYSFDGVNGKGVTVTVSCKGYWDTSTPPLVRKIGAEDGQVVYNICTARAR